jgi:putative ABC transport system permease protein
MMFWINLKIGIRNILKHKVFSFINIIGLAISMSVGLLIISMIIGLSEYDRFHENYDRIYRILSKRVNHTGLKATSPMPIRNALVEEYTGIEKVVTFKRGFGGDASFQKKSVPMFGFFCSEEFFKVFSFKLKSGNPETALKEPFSVVLTKKSAKKLFGDVDPIGKVIRFSERGLVLAGIPNKNKPTYLGDYTVKGVIDDLPAKSHLEFEILASMSTLPILETQGKENALQADWKNIDDVYSYILLDKSKDQDYLESVLGSLSDQKYSQYEDYSVVFTAQPFSKITPGKMYGNPISYRLPITAIYFLAFLALVVILSACFNYTNLSLARSLARAKEIGIRKVSGAHRYQILFQFIGESILISILSLILAIGILELLKPAYNSLWITQYFKASFANDAYIYLIFLGLSVLIGIIAGVLPAAYLSSFKPLKVLRELSSVKVFKKLTLRKTLIVAQFSISLFFIITTTLIYYQLHFLMKAEYGFSKENIINIPLHGNEYRLLAHAIKDYSGILGVSGSSIVPATGGTTSTVLKEIDNPEDSLGVSQMSADLNFIENFQLKLVAGSGFPDDVSADKEYYILLNETATKKLGYDNVHEIIGQAFLTKESNRPLTVIGVVQDFHYSNLMDDIGPFAIRYIPDDFRFINIQYDPMHQDEVLSNLEKEWKMIDNDHVFEPEFMDAQLAESNAFIGDVAYIIGFISIIAVTIASLGLLGMVIFVTETKVKEMGIRKVHGASTGDIIIQLSKGFVIMLIIAIFIATPLAKVANNAWLIQFAVRVNFSIEILGVGILIMSALGLVTIMSQTIRTARTNPSDTLRYE